MAGDIDQARYICGTATITETCSLRTVARVASGSQSCSSTAVARVLGDHAETAVEPVDVVQRDSDQDDVVRHRHGRLDPADVIQVRESAPGG